MDEKDLQFKGYVLDQIFEYCSKFGYYAFRLSEVNLIISQSRYKCPDREINQENQKVIWEVIHNMQHYNWFAQSFEWELRNQGKEMLENLL